MWKEDMAQNTSVRVAVRVGVWSTMLSNGKGYYPIKVKKGKVHPFIGSKALYRLYGP